MESKHYPATMATEEDAATAATQKRTALCGIDLIEQQPVRLRDMGRIGVVTNQACMTSHTLRATVEVLAAAAAAPCNQTKRGFSTARVVCLFSPQHGYTMTEQMNMLESADSRYEFTEEVNTRSFGGNDKEKKQTSSSSSGSTASIPIYSLYGERREPSEAQMSSIDTLVVDLMDVGCRVYTFMYTLALCMRAASKHNKRVVVLDRANPIGLGHHGFVSKQAAAAAAAVVAATPPPRPAAATSFRSRISGKKRTVSEAQLTVLRTPPLRYKTASGCSIPVDKDNIPHRYVDGPVMQPGSDQESFVGWYALPLRHGMTLGELGVYFMRCDERIKDSLKYDVCRVPGLTRALDIGTLRRRYFSSAAPFFPSPNMPSVQTALVYVATVMLEGTNVSEGRGTTQPFSIIGAPWLSSRTLLKDFPRMSFPGVTLMAHSFCPTFDKYKGVVCHGVRIHIDCDAATDCSLFELGHWLLWHFVVHYPKLFKVGTLHQNPSLSLFKFLLLFVVQCFMLIIQSIVYESYTVALARGGLRVQLQEARHRPHPRQLVRARAARCDSQQVQRRPAHQPLRQEHVRRLG
jgi:uncharacterized protein YbbC (DUF1343 family)